MSTVAEIREAIEKLSLEERAELMSELMGFQRGRRLGPADESGRGRREIRRDARAGAGGFKGRPVPSA